MTNHDLERRLTGRYERQSPQESMPIKAANRMTAANTIPPAMVTMCLLPMTPWLFGGVTGSRAVMGAHICTALCDVTPNMRWTSKAKETQHYERLSPHSAQLYHQETH